jgi:hypothetical protein
MGISAIEISSPFCMTVLEISTKSIGSLKSLRKLAKTKHSMPDTWLSLNDIDRLWRVVHGELPVSFMSKKEEAEFLRIIHLIGKQKLAVDQWLTSTIQ